MNVLLLSDETLRRETALTFREKLEIARLLDRLCVDAIEVACPNADKADLILNKTIAMQTRNAAVCARVGEDAASIDAIWESLAAARRPMLQVALPLSTVCMEYTYHKKADGMLAMIADLVGKCASHGTTEFVAEDATRAEPAFLRQALAAAVAAGASRVTVSDSAGQMLPGEFGDMIASLKSDVEGLSGVELMVEINGELHMATACAMEAVKAGANGIKTVARGLDTVVLEKIAETIRRRADYVDAQMNIAVTELHRCTNQILKIVAAPHSANSPFDAGVSQEREDVRLTAGDDMASVMAAVERLGYDLSEEDKIRVYEAWKTAVDSKAETGSRELEAIIATSALQVPETYRLVSYVTHSGNIVPSTAHIVLSRDGANVSGLCEGDGPIDAAFLAIEQILGRHLELDDFQIQSVTEGREAMGSAIVKLRSAGRLYAGRGLSTDIIGASISAYINALNKIIYEEANQ